MHPVENIDEILLDPKKALYAGLYRDTGAIRLSNIPVTPVYAEDPDAPVGHDPVEAFVETVEGRHWLAHLLFEAQRYTSDEIAPIDHLAEMKRFDNRSEHAITFQRTSGERVSFIVGKRPEQDVQLMVDTPYDGESAFHQLVKLSYAEARLLRDLLNRPEVVAVLDQEAIAASV